MSIIRRSLLLLAGFGAATVMLATVPARADNDGRHHELREHREHEGREHEWREHREHEWRERQGFGYAPPPIYYAQPQYYRPPLPYYRSW